MNRTLLPLLILFLPLLASCKKTQVDTGKSVQEVQEALQQFFSKKHPSYGELLQLQKKGLSRTEEETKRLWQLSKETPVSGIVHSYPRGPVYSFNERTNFKIKQYRSITLNLNHNKDGTSSLQISVKTQEKSPDIPFADTPPISEADLRQLLNLPEPVKKSAYRSYLSYSTYRKYVRVNFFHIFGNKSRSGSSGMYESISTSHSKPNSSCPISGSRNASGWS